MAAMAPDTSNAIPVFKDPAWLTEIDLVRAKHDPLPLDLILPNSLFYPGSGIDGDPVKYLSHSTNSFVYCDYRVSKTHWESELSRKCFRGYTLKLRRQLVSAELAPTGFSLPPLEPGDEELTRRDSCTGGVDYLRFEWLIYERDREAAPAHGPQRFSLLFLGVDGVAAFHTLYVQRVRAAPSVVAIIQAPMGFGNNWTDFERPSGSLARSVLSNPAGAPLALFYGGRDFGDAKRQQHFRAAPCWPDYSRLSNSSAKHDDGVVVLWTLPALGVASGPSASRI
jgi:hypothetical protein